MQSARGNAAFFFVLKWAFIAVGLNQVFGYLIVLAGFSADIGIYDLTNDSHENIINALPDLIIVGPLIETILSQALPYEILKKFTPKIWILILNAITFGLLHFEGKTAMILLATLDGLFLSFSYIAWRDFSIKRAILATWILHALLNASSAAAALWLPIWAR